MMPVTSFEHKLFSMTMLLASMSSQIPGPLLLVTTLPRNVPPVVSVTFPRLASKPKSRSLRVVVINQVVFYQPSAAATGKPAWPLLMSLLPTTTLLFPRFNPM